MKRIALVLALVMTLSLFAGCKTDEGSSTASGTDSQGGNTSTTDTITIGMLTPLTGSIAVTGEYAKMGAEIFKQEVEAAGGIKIGDKSYMVDFVWADDEGKPEIAVNAMQKLINQDGVKAVVCTDASKDLIASASVAQQAKVPVIGSTTTNDKVTQEGDYIFRACFIDSYQGVAAAKYCIDKLGAKTASILYSNADDYATGLAQSFEDAFKDLGGKILTKEAYAGADVKDFNAQITSLKQAGDADVLWMPNNFGELGLQIKQLKDAGVKSQLLGPDSWDNPAVAELAGAANAEGCMHMALFSPESPDERIKSFVSKFEELYPDAGRPTGNAYLTYESLLIFQYAWQTAGTFEDTAKVRDTLAAIKDLDLPSGKFSYDENRNPSKTAYVMILDKDGKSVYHDAVEA